MEVNVKEQTEKLNAEITQLNSQLQQVDAQIAQLQQTRNNVVATILKKAGALELLQGLDGDKPKE